MPSSFLLMYEEQGGRILAAQKRSLITLGLCVVSEECKYLQKLSHISAGLNHPVANLTTDKRQVKGSGCLT